jgi:hypothetical protein
MRALFGLAAILASTSVLAQDHHPYAGMQERGIKGLSDEQIADLRDGRGMGLALPAELNGYPGSLARSIAWYFGGSIACLPQCWMH